jgi:hypothetical protein
VILLNLVLWGGGLALLAVGILMIREPLGRLRALQETEANLRRYDDWRGTRLVDDGARTGADEMKDQLRSRVRLWGAAIVAGIVLLIVGFVVR